MLSLNELCRRIQLSKPALYREFGGEDGLMEAALLRYRGSVLEPLQVALAADVSLDELITGLVHLITAEGASHPGCLFTELRAVRARLGPLTRARLAAIEDERRQALRDWYSRAAERGEVGADLNPATAARYLDAQLSLALLQVGAGEAPAHARVTLELALQPLRGTRLQE